MKLIFNTRCVDKHTEKVYEVGDVVEFEDKRGLEIIQSSFASELPDEKPVKKTKTKKEE